ncbi:hypothetical protein I317_07489 [Kwoniella heveanensis CBS 569]|uniref:Uncharacterized protein n=1 Tax=Kwoniella heveanensis BCC8398 TaxID=1296120 RepID=A0A1B9GL01_9TREE|nr:hypothetical protein I316_06648 [Kwoniella heveanensis BCC8398]OCF38732.1 hypothetical protein I317_07489 [Kwoniella heveanensis CBS 569]
MSHGHANGARPTLLIARKSGKLYVIPITHATAASSAASASANAPNADTTHRHAPFGHGNEPEGGFDKIIDPSVVLPQVLLGGEESVRDLHWLDPIVLASSAGYEDAVGAQGGNGGQKLDEGAVQRLWEGWFIDDPRRSLSLSAFNERVAECEMQVMRSLTVVGNGKTYKSVIEKKVCKRQEQLQHQASSAGKMVEIGGLKTCVGLAEGWKLKGNE